MIKGQGAGLMIHVFCIYFMRYNHVLIVTLIFLNVYLTKNLLRTIT